MQPGFGLDVREGNDNGDLLGEGLVEQHVDVQLHGDGTGYTTAGVPERLRGSDERSDPSWVPVPEQRIGELRYTGCDGQLHS